MERHRLFFAEAIRVQLFNESERLVQVHTFRTNCPRPLGLQGLGKVLELGLEVDLELIS